MVALRGDTYSASESVTKSQNNFLFLGFKRRKKVWSGRVRFSVLILTFQDLAVLWLLHSRSHFRNLKTVNKNKSPLVSLLRYCSALKNMRLTEDRVGKVVNNRICSAAFHPCSSSLLMAAGNKWGQVGLWKLVCFLCSFLYNGVVNWYVTTRGQELGSQKVLSY